VTHPLVRFLVSVATGVAVASVAHAYTSPDSLLNPSNWLGSAVFLIAPMLTVQWSLEPKRASWWSMVLAIASFIPISYVVRETAWGWWVVPFIGVILVTGTMMRLRRKQRSA
jgi:hypothetical protein